jgi:hypothetical protein
LRPAGRSRRAASYTAGGAKLLRRIANHAIEGTWALLIGSP